MNKKSLPNNKGTSLNVFKIFELINDKIILDKFFKNE